MSEPKPLLVEEATELEHKLLRALAEERPSPALSERMAAGLAAAGATLPAAVGKTAGLTLGKGAVLAAVAVGIVGGGAWLGHRIGQPTSAPPATSLPSERARSDHPEATEPASLVSVRNRGAVPSAESPAPESADAIRTRSVRAANPAAAAPAARARASAAASPSSVEGSQAEPEERVADDISEQIRMLDAAKRALRQGDPARALRELSSYRQRFPAGGLAQEATVLRIQALAQAGDRDTATRLARRFAARHPSSPHVERLTHLLGRAERPPNPSSP